MEPTDTPSAHNLVATAVLMEGGLGVLAVGIGWLLGWNPLALASFQWSAVFWGVVGAVPMLLILVGFSELPWWPFADVADVVDRLLRPLFAHSTVAELALISVLAGIGEELFFRGLIQEGLAEWIGEPYGTILGLAVASLLFGLLHPINAAYMILATGMGLFLGWLWIANGNLLVPIITHGLYDFAALIWMVKFDARGDGKTPSNDS